MPWILHKSMVLLSTMPPSSAFLLSLLSTNVTVWVFITMLEPSDKQLLLTEATENSCSASHEGDGKSKDRSCWCIWRSTLPATVLIIASIAVLYHDQNQIRAERVYFRLQCTGQNLSLREVSQKPKAGTGAETMEEKCWLDCFSWLIKLACFYNSGPPNCYTASPWSGPIQINH